MINLSARFYPSWFHENYAMTFGERYSMELGYRVKIDMEQQRLLFERFGDIGLGNADPKPEPNIGAVYKNLIAVLFGCRYRWNEYDDGWVEKATLGIDNIRHIEVPKLDGNGYINEVKAQSLWFIEQHGPALLNPGYDGILNIAFALLGDDLFEFTVTEPDIIHHLLKVLRTTTLEVHKYFHNLCGIMNPSLGLGNCTVSMISPQMYEALVMPHDLAWCGYAQSLGVPFGFHMDGKIDKYVEVIAKFPYLNRVDMGSDSNISLARKYLPDKIFRIYLYPQMLNEMNKDEVKQFIRKIADESGHEKDIIFQLDVCKGMSDELVRAVVEGVG